MVQKGAVGKKRRVDDDIAVEGPNDDGMLCSFTHPFYDAVMIIHSYFCFTTRARTFGVVLKASSIASLSVCSK